MIPQRGKFDAGVHSGYPQCSEGEFIADLMFHPPIQGAKIATKHDDLWVEQVDQAGETATEMAPNGSEFLWCGI